MPEKDEEFHQIHVVPKYVFDVNTLTKMTLAFPNSRSLKFTAWTNVVAVSVVSVLSIK